MKNFKKIICIVLSVIALFTLVSCSTAGKYKDDVSLDQLREAVINAVPENNGYTLMGKDYVSLEFSKGSDITENTSGYCIFASTTSSNVNECGIFIVNGDKAKVKAAVEEYLNSQVAKLRSMLQMYSESELAKLDEAKVTVYGNYVIYTIFSKEQTKSALNAIENLLKAE